MQDAAVKRDDTPSADDDELNAKDMESLPIAKLRTNVESKLKGAKPVAKSTLQDMALAIGERIHRIETQMSARGGV